ncbi:hypothetical protein [Oleiagrimonas soli]|uniref:Uncharacterized protein n=1 Tax=Oleiagrimonas soli TaxID=1543381 RepID=A0A841KI34_9GAMM|nr:hypothetical protein [Oleiagrimonas soli]
MGDVLFTSLWVGPLLCFMLWLSDYQLTVVVARMYQAQDKVVFPGSYELNPLTQRDVDALRRIGFRILFKPACMAAFVAAVGVIPMSGDTQEMVSGTFLRLATRSGSPTATVLCGCGA